jgi:hypothetical protein
VLRGDLRETVSQLAFLNRGLAKQLEELAIASTRNWLEAGTSALSRAINSARSPACGDAARRTSSTTCSDGIPQTVVMVVSRTSPPTAVAQFVPCTDRLPISCADAGCASKVRVKAIAKRENGLPKRFCQRVWLRKNGVRLQ